MNFFFNESCKKTTLFYGNNKFCTSINKFRTAQTWTYQISVRMIREIHSFSLISWNSIFNCQVSKDTTSFLRKYVKFFTRTCENCFQVYYNIIRFWLILKINTKRL